MKNVLKAVVLSLAFVGSVVAVPKITGVVTAKINFLAQKSISAKNAHIAKTSVFRVVTNKGMGTGFLVEAENGHLYVISNEHVCGDAKELKLQSDGIGYYDAEVIRTDSKVDLCLILPPRGIEGKHKPLKLEDRNWKARFGKFVSATGHPEGGERTTTIGRAITSYPIGIGVPYYKGCENPRQWFIYTFCLEYYQAVEVSTPIKPGNSGSPAMNWKGNVVGVFFASYPFRGTSYYIPLETLYNFLGGK